MRIARKMASKICNRYNFPVTDDAISCAYLALVKTLRDNSNLYFKIRTELIDYWRWETHYNYSQKTKEQYQFVPFNDQVHCNGTEQKVLIKQILDRLPAGTRNVIVKKYWYGMSCREIGIEMGKSTNWVEYEIRKLKKPPTKIR
jgi:RNA polymerase sigma factor (sigma-70 family)